MNFAPKAIQVQRVRRRICAEVSREKVCSYVETNPHLDTLALSPRGSDNHRSASDLTLT